MPPPPPIRGEILELLEQALDAGMPHEVIERLQWFLHFAQQRSVSATCRHFKIARTTFYRWLKRFDPSDLSSLTNQPLYQAHPLQFEEEHSERSRAAPSFFDRRIATLITIFILLNITFLALAVPTIAFGASSWNPTLLVNTEAFQVIDDADMDSDVYIQFGDTLQKKLTYERHNERFNFNDDVNIQGTASGTRLHAESLLTSSGTLSVEGAAMFGSTVELSGVTYTFPHGDGSASGKVLKTDGAGQLSWATDSNESGLDQDTADDRYVRVAGDTMTGALLITQGGERTWTAETTLEVQGTMSGRRLSIITSQVTNTGAVFIQVAGNGTGILLDSESSTQAGIAVDMPEVLYGYGNALNPHLLFGYDGTFDTNLYRSAARRLATDGSLWVQDTLSGSTLTIMKNDSYLLGNVGIGTTSPGDPLHVKADANGDNIRLEEYSGGEYWQVGITSAGDMQFRDEGTARVTFQDGGRVGINTTSPNYQLHVAGTAGFNDYIYHNGDADTYMYFSTDYFQLVAGGASVYTASESTTDTLTFGTTYNAIFNTNTLFAGGTSGGYSGRVGVGTVAPAAKLEVENATAGLTALLVDQNATGGIGIDVDSEATNQPGVRISMPTNNAANNPHLLFGYNATFDVNLYRSAPNVLKTDDTLRIKGNLEVEGTMSGGLISSMIWYLDGDISTGANQGATIIMPVDFKVTDVDMKVKTAPTGSSLIIDINKAGSSIFSTRPEIDSGSTREDGNHVISDAHLGAGSEVTLDVDQVGSSTAGNGLTVILKGIRRY